ncbi:hypothetical protein HHK36_011136 [Tetracentron sinense]|uniref:Protein kinase domain-containing protein n=1 Tax=Tetracentron sinense TaxID=13715 RepID=A0A834ZFN2_TETSI|nr:hypothetical protein HHK36_011136 [Tetracentron sinense]
MKGRLEDGTVVAVKVHSVESRQGLKEFMSEIAAISNISHENLVKLHGVCIDGTSRILVYEYMENNSLAQTLLECRTSLLLIGVFMFLVNYKCERGYLAPEYAISGHLKRKYDVYSFGVLLLEILSGRSVVNFDLEFGEYYLVEKVRHWQNLALQLLWLLQLMDPTLLGHDFPNEEAVRFLKVGLLCVQETRPLRPQMSTAVEMMCDEIDINDVQISQPGLIPDFMDYKIGH